jgi:hypothetical protein
MVVHTSSEQTNISSRDAGSALLADAANISTGVTASASASESTTLYVAVDGAVELTVEASPDGGSTWFVLPESPLSLDAPAQGEDTNDDAVVFGYDFNRLRLTASTADVSVTAAIREVV